MTNLVGLIAFFDGYKTYIAAAGLFGLALHQFSVGEYTEMVKSLSGGLGACGLRHAIAKEAAK